MVTLRYLGNNKHGTEYSPSFSAGVDLPSPRISNTQANDVVFIQKTSMSGVVRTYSLEAVPIRYTINHTYDIDELVSIQLLDFYNRTKSLFVDMVDHEGCQWSVELVMNPITLEYFGKTACRELVTVSITYSGYLEYSPHA